jgi:hypothetical protein
MFPNSPIVAPERRFRQFVFQYNNLASSRGQQKGAARALVNQLRRAIAIASAGTIAQGNVLVSPLF